MNTFRFRFVLICAAFSTLPFCTATPPTIRPQQNQTKGTNQVAGGVGQFGTTYTLVSSDGFGPVNFTLLSAAYSLSPVSMKPGDNYAPKQNEKMMVIHYRIKNPNSTDMYYSGRPLFQAVDANNNLIDDIGESRQPNSKDMIAVTLKPGQGVDDIITCIVVPAQGAISKLILKLGRAGSKDMVIRYPIPTKTNIVKPIPAPFADPSDKTGATALTQLPGTLKTAYPAGFFDLSVDNIALSAGPLGNFAAGDGMQFLVATVTVTNKTSAPLYWGGDLNLALKTDDDKITDFQGLKASSDVGYDGMMMDPGESTTERCVLQVPKTAHLKNISVVKPIDSGSSRMYIFDLSSVK